VPSARHIYHAVSVASISQLSAVYIFKDTALSRDRLRYITALHFPSCVSPRSLPFSFLFFFFLIVFPYRKVIPRRRLSTFGDPPLSGKPAVTFIPKVLSKVDHPFRSLGFEEFARKFHPPPPPPRSSFFSRRDACQDVLNIAKEIMSALGWRATGPRTGNRATSSKIERVLSPKYLRVIDILPTHDQRNVINARNKRRQRKI